MPDVLTPQGEALYCEIPLDCGLQYWGWVFGETASLPLLPVLMWPFYPLSWGSCVAVFRSFSGGIIPCVAVNGVPMEGGEFRIFIHCHLESLTF